MTHNKSYGLGLTYVTEVCKRIYTPSVQNQTHYYDFFCQKKASICTQAQFVLRAIKSIRWNIKVSNQTNSLLKRNWKSCSEGGWIEGVGIGGHNM